MKILYTATMLSHICQFHLPHLQMLQEHGHTVHVAAHNNLDEKNGLQLRYADRYIEIPFERSPRSPRNVKAYRELKKLLDAEHYDVIVCNTPVGGVVTRLAARRTRRMGTRVIYIAHGFHFFKGAPRKNWLLFFPLEKVFAKRFTDVLVTINREDYDLARIMFSTDVRHIHGVGVRAERYHPLPAEEQAVLREREGLNREDFVILCTGELLPNKNQSLLLQAAAGLKTTVPRLTILLAGNGPERETLEKQTAELGLENTVRFLGYRTDLENVAPAADVIVSCSRREGMPLNVIEGMLCAKPVVASHNRGHDELVLEGETGLLFNPDNPWSLAAALQTLYDNPTLRESYGRAGLERAREYTAEAVAGEVAAILGTDVVTGDG